MGQRVRVERKGKFDEEEGVKGRIGVREEGKLVFPLEYVLREGMKGRGVVGSVLLHLQNMIVVLIFKKKITISIIIFSLILICGIEMQCMIEKQQQQYII